MKLMRYQNRSFLVWNSVFALLFLHCSLAWKYWLRKQRGNLGLKCLPLEDIKLISLIQRHEEREKIDCRHCENISRTECFKNFTFAFIKWLRRKSVLCRLNLVIINYKSNRGTFTFDRTSIAMKKKWTGPYEWLQCLINTASGLFLFNSCKTTVCLDVLGELNFFV